ncbi:MAG: ISL3 family transposase [Sphingomonas sanguinis]|jgi:transposase|nr:ISL3 family transposase [Methylobacterium sp. yr596]MBZ6417170.1 ISL3 family transposase [Methylobacterium sp.]SFF77053.1 Transposase [Methylobacterium sp. yr596]
MTDLLRLSRLAFVDSYDEDGTLIVQAKSIRHHEPYGCCPLFSFSKMGTKTVRYRDHAIQGQPTWLEIKRQRFRCNACGKVGYEVLPDIDTERRITKRFREHLQREAIKYPFTMAAEINGVHETLIRRIFDEHAKRVMRKYNVVLPRVLGMDEIYIMKRPRFVIGDVENSLMLDMQESRKQTNLNDYFEFIGGGDKVEVVCQDMWSTYRSVTRKQFPNAVTVIDKYHVQRTANAAVELVRKAHFIRISNQDRIRLKRKKGLLLARWDKASDKLKDDLEKLFVEFPNLRAVYEWKERFYDIYECETRAAAEKAMTEWMLNLPPEFERPFKQSRDAVKNWRPHILRYFEHRYTSAYIERLNGLIRKMNVQGAGYDFSTLRAKALLKHGRVDREVEGQKLTNRLARTLPAGPRLVPIYGPWRYYGMPLSTLEADLEAGLL